MDETIDKTTEKDTKQQQTVDLSDEILKQGMVGELADIKIGGESLYGGKDKDVNARQEKFCQLYATDREFFGNGVQSYIEAYDPDTTKPNWYKTACSSASQLLSNIKVIARINEILEETGLNDAFTDKQLSFLIAQHSSFDAKLGAIKEYNKLKARITDKLDVTTKGQPILLPKELLNVLPDNGDNENKQTQETDKGGARGNISVQNNIHSIITDSLRPAGQNSNPDISNQRELPPSETRSDTGLPANNAGA